MRRLLAPPRTPIRATRDDEGQAVTEYVLLIFGIVLFLIVAVSVVTFPVSTAISRIADWTASIQPPAPGGTGTAGGPGSGGQSPGGRRGGGEDNGNNQGNHKGDSRNGR